MLAFSGYRVLLAEPPVRSLLLSSLVARMPLGMNSLALLLLVRSKTGSFALAGLAVGAYSLARACVVPKQGALIDRLGPRWFLLPCAAAQTVLLAGVVLAVWWNGSALLTVALSGLAGAFTPPISPILRTLWGHVVDAGDARDVAYTIDATSQEVIWVVAPLLVALLIGIASPSVSVLSSASIGLCGTGWFAVSPYIREWRTSDHGPQRSSGALGSAGLRVLLVCAALTSVGWGALQVGLPALAVHAGSRQMAGVLLGLWGLGSVIGGFVSGSRVWRSPAPNRYIVLLWLSALGGTPLIGARATALILVLSLTAGLTLSPLNSCQWSLIDRLALPGTISEAFAWDIGVIAAGMALGASASGLLIDHVGLSASFALGCTSTAGAALLAMKAKRTIGSAGR